MTALRSLLQYHEIVSGTTTTQTPKYVLFFAMNTFIMCQYLYRRVCNMRINENDLSKNIKNA